MAEGKEKKDVPKSETSKKEEPQVQATPFDFSFRDEITAEAGGEYIKLCFACGTCAAICPITGIDEQFNCRRIVRQILFGMRQEVLSSPAIWLCLVCARCYVHCPQKVNFPDVMRILRHMAVKGNYVSPDIVQKVREADDLSLHLRHDLIQYSFEQKKEILEGIKQAIGEKLG